ncbi:hypothetical protein CVT24_007308 [Panaeolus cyanescens]|uniref:Uncharacterized protein n=1 Tax=Panaeolus cyanescens TaxID=181874 RepID=A0A409VJ71_9AGAR|nr:hypothetical protein CVT24_007308 [Panaeolus cyanescens]
MAPKARRNYKYQGSNQPKPDPPVTGGGRGGKGPSNDIRSKGETPASTVSPSAVASPLHTPPLSPHRAVSQLPPVSQASLNADPAPVAPKPSTQSCNKPKMSTPLVAADVASPEILAIADLFATMKKTLLVMTNTFSQLGNQAESMISQCHDIKAAEQLKVIQASLEKQIRKQEEDIANLRSGLQAKIKQAIEDKMKKELYALVRDKVHQQIQEKVSQELARQIPAELPEQVTSHRQQVREVKVTIHNTEARHYNATLRSEKNARLRPLLRPLPTPEQSPVIMISRSSSLDNSSKLPTPLTAYPRAPAPTPIKRTSSNKFRSSLEPIPSTPSTLFPADLKALFDLGPEDTKRLLRDYGLSSAMTPTVPKGKGLPGVQEEDDITNALEGANEVDEHDQLAAHAKDMNTFMAHIGVPYLMIPPRKDKEQHSVPLSARTKRRMQLTRLII